MSGALLGHNIFLCKLLELLKRNSILMTESYNLAIFYELYKLILCRFTFNKNALTLLRTNVPL